MTGAFFGGTVVARGADGAEGADWAEAAGDEGGALGVDVVV